jgi:hypothetical protein
MTPKLLVGSKKWIERFLTDCANLPSEGGIWDETDNRAKKVIARYPEVFKHLEFTIRSGREERTSKGLYFISSDLRKIWDAPNLWERNWHVYKLADFYHRAKVRMEHWKGPESMHDVAVAIKEPPPVDDPFMLALAHLQRSDKARRCPNVACQGPYFFATKRRQKHCTPECATECTREQKRQWWHENKDKKGEL